MAGPGVERLEGWKQWKRLILLEVIGPVSLITAAYKGCSIYIIVMSFFWVSHMILNKEYLICEFPPPPPLILPVIGSSPAEAFTRAGLGKESPTQNFHLERASWNKQQPLCHNNPN